MPSFQLWLPTVGYSLTATEVDKESAFKLWRGESRIWLLPGTQSPIRWSDNLGWWSWQSAVPAANLDCLDIFYVTKNGQVAGPNAEKRFPNGSVNGLLMNWLNVEWVCPVGESLEIRFPFTLQVPEFDRRRVTYKEVVVSYQSLPAIPLVAHEWISPMLAFERSADAQNYSLSTADSDLNHLGDDGSQFMDAIFQCPHQLAPLVPGGDFRTILCAQHQMAEISRKSKTDRSGALREAHVAAMPYVSMGYLPRELGWLCLHDPSIWENVVENDSALVRLLYENARKRFRLYCNTFEESQRSREWESVMGQLVPIRRAWGIVGLFWALFLEKLERHQLQACSRCDRIIEGTRGKRFCGPDDDQECYRQRRAHDKCRSRGGRTSEQQDL
jgi:hypothetical protein